MDIDQLFNLVSQQWGERTLANFRADAEKELNGSVFEALREEGGKRAFILICATGEKEISMIEKVFDLSDDFEAANWSTMALAAFLRKASQMGGLAYEDIKDECGNRIAVTICAFSSGSVEAIERIFDLPN